MRGIVTYVVNHPITGHLVFVLVPTELVMVCPAIDNPASCEIRHIIRFLHSKNMSAEEIHRELCADYGASQFRNFRVSFKKFHAPVSTRLSQLG
jgi:hypothetical protein